MLPPRIVARNASVTPEVERDIVDRVNRLTRFHERITSCCVTVEIPQRRHLSDADQYRVRLDIGVPGGEVVIAHQPCAELRTALDEAFSAARRRIEDVARRRRAARHRVNEQS